MNAIVAATLILAGGILLLAMLPFIATGQGGVFLGWLCMLAGIALPCSFLIVLAWAALRKFLIRANFAELGQQLTVATLLGIAVGGALAAIRFSPLLWALTIFPLLFLTMAGVYEWAAKRAQVKLSPAPSTRTEPPAPDEA